MRAITLVSRSRLSKGVQAHLKLSYVERRDLASLRVGAARRRVCHLTNSFARQERWYIHTAPHLQVITVRHGADKVEDFFGAAPLILYMVHSTRTLPYSTL